MLINLVMITLWYLVVATLAPRRSMRRMAITTRRTFVYSGLPKQSASMLAYSAVMALYVGAPVVVGAAIIHAVFPIGGPVW